MPQLVLWAFPDWFAGFCFAAIALGALVPAAVMSIGAANTFTRNIWKPFIHPPMTPREESVLAKLVSLIVKVGALVVIFFMPTQFALDLQLLGGVWMVQIFPAMIFGLYTRWFSGGALLIGWAVGMIVGTSLSWGEKAWTPVHALELGRAVRRSRRPRPGFRRLQRPDRGVGNIVVAALLSLVIRTEAPTKRRRPIMTIAVLEGPNPIPALAKLPPARFEASFIPSVRLRAPACPPRLAASVRAAAGGRLDATSPTRGSPVRCRIGR